MYRKFIVAIALVLAIVTTVLTGVAYAEFQDSIDEHSDLYADFDENLQPRGVSWVGSFLDKRVDPDYAYFVMETVQNSSGYPCYINVRSRECKIVATAASVTGTGSFHVYYLPGYGDMGLVYRPSAQTDTESAVGAHIAGYWRP